MKIRQAKKIINNGSRNYRRSTWRRAVRRLGNYWMACEWIRRMGVVHATMTESNLELMA